MAEVQRYNCWETYDDPLGDSVSYSSYALLLTRAEQAEQRLAVAMHGWDNAKAEVFRLADRLRAIDPEFQSGMHLNSSLAGQALTLLREARETLMTWLKTGEAHAVVQLQSKIDAFLGEV